MKALRHFVNFILYSNLFIAFCATFLTWASTIKFGYQTDIAALVTVFASTLLSYQLHRVVYLKKHKNLKNKVVEWSKKNSFVINASCIFSVIVLLYLIPFLSAKQLLILFVTGIITLLYTIPIGNFRLRNLGWSKILWIAFVWANVTVLLPLCNSQAVNSLLIYEWIERFIFVFCITIPFDLRDVGFDKTEKLQTIPLKIGIKKSKWLAMLLMGGLAISNLIVYQSQYWKLSVLFICLILLIYKSYPRKDDFYYIGLIDGSMILYFLLVYF